MAGKPTLSIQERINQWAIRKLATDVGVAEDQIELIGVDDTPSEGCDTCGHGSYTVSISGWRLDLPPESHHRYVSVYLDMGLASIITEIDATGE